MSSPPELEAAALEATAGDASAREPTNSEVQRLKRAPFGGSASRYALSRAVLLRGVGFIYAVAFLVLVRQHQALIGSNGLLPAAGFFDWAREALGSTASAFWRLPSVFWLGASDWALRAAAWLGLALSLVVMAGFANAPILVALWALYLSFVHVGQIFYGYGWESLLCEAGFLAIFLAPALDPRALPKNSPAPELVILLYRWLTFRVMFGAGLIKIRGDACWTDLTCLAYHYETQPNPNPLSYYLHRLPLAAHKAGVLFNHLVELGAPFAVFGPRAARLVAGALIIAFQSILILSGNLSFLNWLTIVVALSCFDDGVFSRWLPRRLQQRAAASELARSSPARRFSIVLLGVVVALLSINPIVNLLSPRQAMNRSFDPFLLVNTYGAFGSISRERHEVVLEGTHDAEPTTATAWQSYELPCKPGDPSRAPCWVSPYHYRLDWQMWFLQFSPQQAPPWLVHLVAKLLAGDRSTLSLFSGNPFPDRPPRFLRAALYRYRFTRSGEPGYWRRQYLGDLVRPLSREDPDLAQYLRRHHFRGIAPKVPAEH